jgi:hypothetical protein
MKQNPIYCYTASITSQVSWLHKHMGHPACEAMCKAITSGAWQNIKSTVDQFCRAMSQNPCLLCIVVKKTKPKIQHSEQTDSLDLHF